MWYRILISTVCLLFAPALGGSDYSVLGPEGGDVRSLAVHPGNPERFFLGTADGQIYVSEDAGESWNRLAPGLGYRGLVVDNLVFDPRDPDVLYAGCWELQSSRGWLFRTEDGGQTWTSLSLGRESSSVRAVAVAPSNPDVLAVGITEGVLLSRDRGRSWGRITRGYRSLYNVESLAFDPTDAATLYVGTWRLGWKTEDSGDTWNPIHEGMIFDSDMFSLLVNPQEPAVLFSSACTGVYRSDNGGAKWEKLNNGLPSEAKRTRTLHLDPANPDRVFAGTTIGLFASEDGGRSWRQLLKDVVVNAVAVHPDNKSLVLVGTDDAGVLRSLDGGDFSPSNRGFVHRQVSVLAFHKGNPGHLYAAVDTDSDHGGIFVSSDQGRTWMPLNKGLQSKTSKITKLLAAPNSDRVFLGTSQGIYAGSAVRAEWEKLATGSTLPVRDLAFADSDGSSLAVATPDKLYSLDLQTGSLKEWKISVYDGPIHGVFWDEESGTLLAATDMGVFQTAGKGSDWVIRVKGLPPVRVNFVNRCGISLCAATSDGIYLSRDLEEEGWFKSRMNPELEIVALEASPADPRSLFAVDSTGFFLFRSEDGGEQWAPVRGDNWSRLRCLAFLPAGDLLAGTYSEGIYSMRLGSGSSVSGE